MDLSASDVRFQKLKSLISKQLEVDESKVTASAEFGTDLGVDSLTFAELIMNLEEEFDIVIPDEIALKLTTVGAAYDYVLTHMIEKFTDEAHEQHAPTRAAMESGTARTADPQLPDSQ